MKIFRFDPEVSVPIARFGPDFRIGRLTGDDTSGRMQIFHLPARGAVKRRPAVSVQLFAVVAGTGWVRGGDGRRRPIGTDQAALWEPGEDHSAGSNDGLTAASVEGDFHMEATPVAREIVVDDYDPQWGDDVSEIQRVIDAVDPLGYTWTGDRSRWRSGEPALHGAPLRAPLCPPRAANAARSMVVTGAALLRGDQPLNLGVDAGTERARYLQEREVGDVEPVRRPRLRGRPHALVIGARHDTMDPAHMESVAAALPAGRYLFCPSGSHLAMYDNQRTYFSGIVAFFKEARLV